MSWAQLADFGRSDKQEREEIIRLGPQACPLCGEPLQRNARTNLLGCTFDGWTEAEIR